MLYLLKHPAAKSEQVDRAVETASSIVEAEAPSFPLLAVSPLFRILTKASLVALSPPYITVHVGDLSFRLAVSASIVPVSISDFSSVLGSAVLELPAVISTTAGVKCGLAAKGGSLLRSVVAASGVYFATIANSFPAPTHDIAATVLGHSLCFSITAQIHMLNPRIRVIDKLPAQYISKGSRTIMRPSEGSSHLNIGVVRRI
jgi:hypothetical protein